MAFEVFGTATVLLFILGVALVPRHVQDYVLSVRPWLGGVLRRIPMAPAVSEDFVTVLASCSRNWPWHSEGRAAGQPIAPPAASMARYSEYA